MSETYSGMVERIMRDNSAKFALEYERRMYESPELLRYIEREERQKMSDMKLTDAEKHHMVVRSLDSLSAKIEALEKTNYSDRVHGRFINGEFDGIKQRIEALENPPRKEAEDAAQRLWEQNVDRYMKSLAARLHVLECANHIETAETWSIDGNPVPREPKRPRYEYDIIRYNSRPSDEEILEKLNDFGLSGWELVLVKDWTYFIRREIFP